MGDSIQMNNKYIVSLLAAGILLLSLAGCGENKEVVATKNAIDSIGEVAASVENSTNQTKESFDRMYALFKKNSFSELSFMQRLKLLFLGHT